MSEMKAPLFYGIHDILFKITDLDMLYDFLLEFSFIEFNIWLESLNYHRDWFVIVKATDTLFMNHYLEKDFTFC